MRQWNFRCFIVFFFSFSSIWCLLILFVTDIKCCLSQRRLDIHNLSFFSIFFKVELMRWSEEHCEKRECLPMAYKKERKGKLSNTRNLHFDVYIFFFFSWKSPAGGAYPGTPSSLWNTAKNCGKVGTPPLSVGDPHLRLARAPWTREALWSALASRYKERSYSVSQEAPPQPPHPATDHSLTHFSSHFHSPKAVGEVTLVWRAFLWGFMEKLIDRLGFLYYW